MEATTRLPQSSSSSSSSPPFVLRLLLATASVDRVRDVSACDLGDRTTLLAACEASGDEGGRQDEDSDDDGEEASKGGVGVEEEAASDIGRTALDSTRSWTTRRSQVKGGGKKRQSREGSEVEVERVTSRGRAEPMAGLEDRSGLRRQRFGEREVEEW